MSTKKEKMMMKMTKDKDCKYALGGSVKMNEIKPLKDNGSMDNMKKTSKSRKC
jgi:hypothetical protein